MGLRLRASNRARFRDLRSTAVRSRASTGIATSTIAAITAAAEAEVWARPATGGSVQDDMGVPMLRNLR